MKNNGESPYVTKSIHKPCQRRSKGSLSILRQRLRANGVDAWLDQWEMKPGDSLVDKIFEEGLKDARAVIIVLSSISVQKPWVREELNASVVSRISRGTKLIPVVIDECEVPESLQSTVWQKIDSLVDYSESFQRILSAIFDVTDKPAMASRQHASQLRRS